MNAKEIQQNIETVTGKSMLSIAEIARWAGRSADYTGQKLLAGVPFIQTGREKLFFAGDVAKALAEKSEINN